MRPLNETKLPPMDAFDYIIVGAGTAGCLLVERLSASGRHRVLVLEAGGSDDRFWIHTPIGYGRTFADETLNWKYQAQPSSGLSGRGMYWPRGRVLGGSGSINALVYCRGLPVDFDGWRARGNVGWGWKEDVLPCFEKLERKVDPSGHAITDGAVDVKDVHPFLHEALGTAWREAARELNLGWTSDFNGPQPEGLGYYHLTIRHGRRQSAADAFLRPALRRRDRVKLETRAWVSRIRFSGGRAQGVEWWRDGREHYSAAAGEIILCAGTVNSPQVLQLSGIGPGATLAAHGIPPVVDNGAVGAHLQDHLGVVYSFKANCPTLNGELHSAWAQFRTGLRYLLARAGPMALSVNQFGGFVRAAQGARWPDMQLYFNPVTYRAGEATRTRIEVDEFPGFYLCFQPMRPTSEGRIDIASGKLS